MVAKRLTYSQTATHLNLSIRQIKRLISTSRRFGVIELQSKQHDKRANKLGLTGLVLVNEGTCESV